ncbi:MAG: tRNA (adenosine(37)-N6)-threonylcarbamoyltransferase complex transferase subunit TsaD [Patescibacteria group bacterium]
MTRILAIESSCDETAIAILRGSDSRLVLEKNLIYSQVNIHKKYGGVIPEVAARKHLQTIIPLLNEAVGKDKLKNIDYLAVTVGPGLITSLLLGVATAKTLAYAAQKPLLAINHLEGHIYSNWLTHQDLVDNTEKYLPAIVLVVSGGHTELVLMRGHGQYQLLGQTLDDAVGEAFDKVAKLLSLGYPGGPVVSHWAISGQADKFLLPRPMINTQDFDFSLSGLKTAVLYILEKKKHISQLDVADICASFEQAIVEVLVKKTIGAAKKYRAKSIMLAGGVAANVRLQVSLADAAREIDTPFFAPLKSLTGDNAAMIAAAAYYRLASHSSKGLGGQKLFFLEPDANWQLSKK